MKILTVDSSNSIYRNFHVMMSSTWMKKDVESLNDMMMKSFIKETRDSGADAVISLWDFGRPEHRLQALPEYKISREESDPIIKESREFLHDMLPKLGIVSVGSKFAEADDLAFLISKIYPHYKGRMVSTDYDWLQSITENWEVHRPVNGELYDMAAMREYYGDTNTIEVFMMTKSIIGDASDEIPGIPGIAEGTGIPLAKKLVHGEDLGNGKRANDVRENMEQITRNRSVISMDWILQAEEMEFHKNLLKDMINLTKFQPKMLEIMQYKKFFPNSDLGQWAEYSRNFKTEQLLTELN